MSADLPDASGAAHVREPIGILSTLVFSLRYHAGLLAIIGLFILTAIVVGRLLDMPTHESLWAYLPTYMVLMPVSVMMLLVGYGIYIIVILRPQRPLRLFATQLRERFLRWERIVLALPILFFVPLFGGAFTLLKAAIPRLQPFSWDANFAAWDETLHFGYAPWELLQPILGSVFATAVIDWLYALWFFLLAIVWTWQAFSLRDPILRLRFLYSLLLIWIVYGVIAATLLSSAGPCFYGFVVDGPDPYQPLLDHLAAVNASDELASFRAQQYLWEAYLRSDVELGGGISAMPSIHVAMSLLFVLVGFRTARWLGCILSLYLGVILTGSVLLGWHYAIDGYAMLLGVPPIWWLAGRLAAVNRPWIWPSAGGVPTAPVRQ